MMASDTETSFNKLDNSDIILNFIFKSNVIIYPR